MFIFILSYSFAFEPPKTKGITLVSYDSQWSFWADEKPPTEWPVLNDIISKDAFSLVPDTIAESPDRWAFIQKKHIFLTAEAWWSGFFAPFSIRDAKQFQSYLPIIKNTQRNRKRKGLQPFSRTELIYEDDNHPLEYIYFTREVEFDNPEQYDALQIQAKFNNSIDVYINDTLLVQEKIPQEKENPFPFFYQFNIGKSDRWEYSWQGLPNKFIKGKNTISVRIQKSKQKNTPKMYFDLQIIGHKNEWLKTPYLMNPTSTSIVVGFETSVSSNAEIEVCKKNEPQDCFIFSDNEETTLHNISISNLASDNLYTYEVRYNYNGHVTSYPIQKFRTLPSNQSSFSFYLYGDSRGNDKVHTKIANGIVKDNQQSQSLFVVHTGDMVTHGYMWRLWEMFFFHPTENLYRELPIIPVLGNHEQNQKLYYDYFNLPNNESWYTFKQGNTQFFALNTNIDFSPSSMQYKWFESELKKNTSRWKIVIFHHPPFSCSPIRKPGAQNVRNHLVPLMEQYKVNLVLLGHDHLYGRSNAINGIIYITSGGGGAMLYDAESDDINPVCIKKHHFVRFDVENSNISWKAIDIEGNIIDEFQIK